MKYHSNSRPNAVINNGLSLISNKIKSMILLILSLIIGFGFTTELQAQVVNQPVAGISTSIKKYTYTYNISSSQKKDIRYIIVKNSAGDIKSCFDACDVCYPYNKGYSQSGSQLRCNNCGKTFNIDALGTPPPPNTCNPGYLPNTNGADSVTIVIADLVKGAYLFPLLATDVTESANPPFSIEIYGNSEIKVKLSVSNPKFFKIYNIEGGLCKNIINISNEFNININDLITGAYFISAEFESGTYSQSFYILR